MLPVQVFQGSLVDWNHFLHDPGSSGRLETEKLQMEQQQQLQQRQVSPDPGLFASSGNTSLFIPSAPG